MVGEYSQTSLPSPPWRPRAYPPSKFSLVTEITKPRLYVSFQVQNLKSCHSESDSLSLTDRLLTSEVGHER